MKLKVESLSGIIANKAVFLSPICSSSISSYLVSDASSSKLKAASLTPTEIKIDFAVLPAACLYILYCFNANELESIISSLLNNSSKGLS